MIQQGLLWFDDTPTRATADKIARAVARYNQKYGHKPDVCYVHPSLLPVGETVPIDGVQILTSHGVLPNHFWLGVQETPEQAKARASNKAKLETPNE
jgi:hypothetical protein